MSNLKKFVYPKFKSIPIVRMRNLSIKDPKKKKLLKKAFNRVMEHGQLILGKEVNEFERKLCEINDCKFAVGVSSGSAGLLLAVKASGIVEGDEVITTPMSWLVTSSVIKMVGAIPVFADVDENYNLDPTKIMKLITKKTKAILPVHFYGKIAQIDKIKKICNENKLVLIEDVAQAFGTSLNKKKAGTFGDIGVFSFGPMKVHGALGDAGAIIFNKKKYLKKIISLRQCGTIDNEICIYPEIKHNLDSLQAAFLKSNLELYAKTKKKRYIIACHYKKLLNNKICCPNFEDYDSHSFYDFTILVEKREKIIIYLYQNKIEVKVRHPFLINEQPIFKNLPKYNLPNASKFIKKILQLPMHDNLTLKQVEYVSNKINNFYNKYI